MKYLQFKSFEKHLLATSSLQFSPAYLIIGKDHFERKQALEFLIKHLSAQTNIELESIVTLEAEKIQKAQLIQELGSLSFFSPTRLFILSNIERLLKPCAEWLESYLASLPEQTYLVLTGASLNANTKLYKALERAGIILELPEEKPWEKEKRLIDWVIEEARKEQTQIDPPSAQLLVRQIGPNMALLYQELQKLVCYVIDKKKIQTQDIKALCGAEMVENIWKLGEALFKRDTKQALFIAKGLLDEGQAFLSILRQIRTQFQTGFQICSLLQAGQSSADISQLFPYMKGKILETNISSATHYGAERYKKGLLLIDEYELISKNSGTELKLLFEKLIFKLTL